MTISADRYLSNLPTILRSTWLVLLDTLEECEIEEYGREKIDNLISQLYYGMEMLVEERDRATQLLLLARCFAGDDDVEPLVHRAVEDLGEDYAYWHSSEYRYIKRSELDPGSTCTQEGDP